MRIIAQVISILLGVAWCNVYGQPAEITERTLSVERMFVDAKKAMLIGSPEQAIVLYDKVLELQPGNSVAAFELAKAYLNIDSTDKALDRINFALGNDPSNKYYLLTKIDILKKLDNHADVIQCYASLIEIEPGNPDYIRALAFAYVQNDQLKEAVEVFDDMEGRYGVLKNISLIKHDLYKQMGKYKQAEEELLDLINVFPSNIDFQYHLARFYLQENRKQEAENWFRNMLKIDPDDSRATLALAQFNSSYGSTDYLQSIRPILKSSDADIELKIKELMPYVVDLQATMDQERSETLIAACKDLTLAHPNEAKAHALLGDVLSISEKLDEAIASFKTTVGLDPSNYMVWEQLCVLLKETRSYDELMQSADEGLIYFPNQPLLYFFIGSAQYELGLPNKAVENFELALNLSGNKAEITFNVLPGLAKAYKDVGEFDNAQDSYRKALEIQPEHPLLNLDYAYLLLEKDKTIEANNRIQLAEKALPNYPLVSAIKALSSEIDGNTQAANELISKALANSEEAIIQEVYGDILFRQNLSTQALSAYQKANDLGKRNKALIDKIQGLQ